MSWPAKLSIPLCVLLIALAHSPATAAPETPVVTKDGSTFVLDDLSLYFLRNLGKEGLLDFLQNMVVYQEGIKQGLKPTAAETTTFIDDKMGRDVYTQFKQLYSAKAVDQLVEYTLVNSKYETWLRDKIKREKNYTATEKEAHDYFLQNIEQFHLPEGAYLSIISVESQAQANAVLERLKKGETFNAVAGEVNMDPQMRAVQGEIGPYRKGEGLPKPLEDAALALKEGEFSRAPVQGTNFHLLFCHKKYAAVQPTFEDVKEALMHDLLESKIDPLYVDAMDNLMRRELPRFAIQADLFKPADEPATASARPGGASAQ